MARGRPKGSKNKVAKNSGRDRYVHALVRGLITELGLGKNAACTVARALLANESTLLDATFADSDQRRGMRLPTKVRLAVPADATCSEWDVVDVRFITMLRVWYPNWENVARASGIEVSGLGGTYLSAGRVATIYKTLQKGASTETVVCDFCGYKNQSTPGRGESVDSMFGTCRKCGMDVVQIETQSDSDPPTGD